MSINKNFVVKNGFEVSTDLILANADTRRVGIASTNPQYTLDVAGGIGATDLRVTGVSTLNTLYTNTAYINSGIITASQLTSQNLNVTDISTFNNVSLGGYISIGNTTGQQNQVLTSTGVGVTWRTSSNLRTSTTFTATLGQTIFSATYSIGYVDVYINGVKLTNTEFIATNETSVILNDACFGGETVEIISYEVEYPLTFSGITLQEEGSVVGTGINAINFVGTAVTAVSTGSGSTIFVNAQLPLTSSSNVAVGIITASTGFVGNINSSGVSTFTSLVATNINASGIVTATGGFVSIADTTPVTIQLVGNQLTFNAVGIGSTTLTLF
jgi:hypothetical protein